MKTHLDVLLDEKLKNQLKAKLALQGKSIAEWVREQVVKELKK